MQRLNIGAALLGVAVTSLLGTSSAASLDQVIGFGNRSTHGLLDQSRNTRGEKLRSNPMVVNGRRHHADGIHLSNQRLEMVKRGCVKAGSDDPGLLRIGIRNTDEVNIWHIGKNSGMMLAKVPNADHCHPQAAHEFTN